MNQQQLLHWCSTYTTEFSKNRWQKPLIMGILNVTPDSFSDGGRYFSLEAALEKSLQMIREGADILDIGGESSKPGAVPVSVEEELSRVIPVIEHIRQYSDVAISIDTCKSKVMAAAINAGASMVNDITALHDSESREIIAASGIPVCLMHMQGTPQTMQANPAYATSVIEELHHFFESKINLCVLSGIAKEQIILDPGFGFGKTVTHNLQLLKHISAFKRHNRPLLLGVSKKSTIGSILHKQIEQRSIGSLSASLFAALEGAAILRTHDVDALNQAFCMLDAILSS